MILMPTAAELYPKESENASAEMVGRVTEETALVRTFVLFVGLICTTFCLG